MFRRTLVTLLALAWITGVSPASAELGPRDGATLSGTDLERVKTGAAAPDFTLEDLHGEAVTLSDYRGNKSVVLVFYRGHW